MPDVCQKCGYTDNEKLPGGLCPNCLMMAAKAANNAARGGNLGPLQAPSFSRLANAFPELEIIELVGQGGMGAVYKARQKDLDRIVALKIFLYRSDDPEFAERFRREARALGQLNHANIVTVHQFGQRDDMHFLLMEFVDGLNLRQITSDQRLDPALAMQLVPQLCDALQYAHEEGVVHRDIKPENILLDARGNIRIADFGLAKLTNPGMGDGLTHTRQVMGTWNYMAPEQKERPTEVDHRADIYSLGVVIYEMLTGELPLGRFPIPSEKAQVDARIDEILLRALEKDPAKRFQQASDFKTGFASVAASPGVAAMPHRTPVAPVKQAAMHAGAYAETNPNYYQAETGMRLHVAFMSGCDKKGQWTPGSPSLALTCMGGTCLDLSEVKAKQVSIVSFVLMGGCEIVVPHGAIVDVDGLFIMGATDNKVNSTVQVDAPMRVRIRSFGMMGGCEIRTTRAPAPSAQPPLKSKTKQAAFWRRGLVLAYQAFCMLVTIAIPILFLLSSMDFVHETDEIRMVGVLTAIAAGLFWSQLGNVRILLGVRPPEATAEELADFHNATIIGTIARMFAVVCIFGCPILLVINQFENDRDSDEVRVIAIICAVVGGALYLAANYVEELIRGERQI